MSQYAVCYTATPGYLFQTVLSAIQTRRNACRSVEIFIFFLNGEEPTDELSAFARVCLAHQINLAAIDIATLDGLHPTYARLFLDRFLPADVEEILYLDGDTQIVGKIDALIRAAPPSGGILASADPMVLIRQIHCRLQSKIDKWWEEGGVSRRLSDTYINSGVIRVRRCDLEPVRRSIRRSVSDPRKKSRFPDQDAINIALEGRIGLVSAAWNFPGFFLGTNLEESVKPRILHFMSDPRPWNAPLPPFGRVYHEPYRTLATDFPEVARYWNRFRTLEVARYSLQQSLKHLTERRIWNSAAALNCLEVIEKQARDLRTLDW